MKSKVIIILVSCLLGGLSLGAVKWLAGQSERMEERLVLLEQKTRLTAELEAASQELSEVETELEIVRGELAVYQDVLSSIREKTSDFQEICQSDRMLYETQTGGLPVNYDVENFREKQRESEQEGALGYAFGSLFGNMMQSSGQDYSAQGQKNRFDFYERLTDFLEQSYWEAVAAEAAFDGAYLYYQELGGLEAEAELFAYRELLEEADDSLYESQRAELLDALARYVFDLNCTYLIYSNTLTENEVSFLDEIGQQVDSLKALLAEYDPEGSYTGAGESRYGYTTEEKVSRGMYVFGMYAEAAKMLVNYLYADGGMRSELDVNAYHVGFIYGYSNRGDIVMILEKGNLMDVATWEYRFYDHEGNPLYLEEHQGKVLFLDGEAAVFQAATELLQTQAVCDRLVSNAERMFTDYANGVLGSTYQNYAY